MQEMNLIPLSIPVHPETRRAAALPAQNSHDTAPILTACLAIGAHPLPGVWEHNSLQADEKVGSETGPTNVPEHFKKLMARAKSDKFVDIFTCYPT